MESDAGNEQQQQQEWLQGQQQTVAPSTTCRENGQMSWEKPGLRGNGVVFPVPETDTPFCNVQHAEQLVTIPDRERTSWAECLTSIKRQQEWSPLRQHFSPTTSDRGTRPCSRTALWLPQRKQSKSSPGRTEAPGTHPHSTEQAGPQLEQVHE